VDQFWTLAGAWGPRGALVAIVTGFIWALLSGRLVPRQTVVDMREDYKDRITGLASERDAWHSAHDTSEGTRRIMAEQVEKLIAQAGITNQLLSSIKAEAKE
jgi:hypothetical protein